MHLDKRRRCGPRPGDRRRRNRLNRSRCPTGEVEVATGALADRRTASDVFPTLRMWRVTRSARSDESADDLLQLRHPCLLLASRGARRREASRVGTTVPHPTVACGEGKTRVAWTDTTPPKQKTKQSRCGLDLFQICALATLASRCLQERVSGVF